MGLFQGSLRPCFRFLSPHPQLDLFRIQKSGKFQDSRCRCRVQGFRLRVRSLRPCCRFILPHPQLGLFRDQGLLVSFRVHGLRVSFRHHDLFGRAFLFFRLILIWACLGFRNRVNFRIQGVGVGVQGFRLRVRSLRPCLLVLLPHPHLDLCRVKGSRVTFRVQGVGFHDLIGRAVVFLCLILIGACLGLLVSGFKA